MGQEFLIGVAEFVWEICYLWVPTGGLTSFRDQLQRMQAFVWQDDLIGMAEM